MTVELSLSADLMTISVFELRFLRVMFSHLEIFAEDVLVPR